MLRAQFCAVGRTLGNTGTAIKSLCAPPAERVEGGGVGSAKV